MQHRGTSKPLLEAGWHPAAVNMQDGHHSTAQQSEGSLVQSEGIVVHSEGILIRYEAGSRSAALKL